MSKKERVAYTDAVLCLQSKPSISPPGLVPGARSRFDDFQAVHINQTLSIHFNARLLPWHRLFTWLYEEALRNECGYKGYQPYWDWPKYADDPIGSPLFDGSAYSLSGDGEAIPHGDLVFATPKTNFSRTLPPAGGGGCVQGGPFANMTVNLGPLNFNGSLPGYVGSGSGFDYNPRCLTRDINSNMSSQYLNYQAISNAIGNSSTYSDFNKTLYYPGLHAVGHFVIGGLMDDSFTSPGDPAFYFHHAQVDRVWTIWQQQDAAKRQYELTGTTTWFNIPPSPNITMADIQDIGYLGESRSAGDVMSTLDGPFCYVYE
ncbi:hypothetical protein MMC22_002204 [Lobaria immixta]|nr:hypothetical protein [Lobaria immixta]